MERISESGGNGKREIAIDDINVNLPFNLGDNDFFDIDVFGPQRSNVFTLDSECRQGGIIVALGFEKFCKLFSSTHAYRNKEN